MALGNNDGGGKKFVTIHNGKWTLRVPEGTEGAIARTLEGGPNEGSPVWELYYGYIDGDVVGGYIRDGKYGTDICLNLKDDGVVYTVQIPVNSMYFTQFAKAAPNIDPTKKLFMGLGYDKENGRNFIYMKQDGQTVRSAFTKDNPNGMPAPIKKKVMGQDKDDYEERDNFLYEKVIDFFSIITTEEAPF